MSLPYTDVMKTLTVGNLKTHFSEVLAHVRQGKEYGIAYGKKKEAIAIIIPIQKYVAQQQKKLGILESDITVQFKPDYKITDQELLQA